MNEVATFFEQDTAVTQDEFKEDKQDLGMQSGLEEAGRDCLVITQESGKLSQRQGQGGLSGSVD